MNETQPKAATEDRSVIDRLRSQRNAALDKKTLVMEIPGWSGMLHVRYKPVPWDAMTRLADADTDSPEGQLKSNLDVLIAACDAILVKENGKLRELADVLREQGEQVHGSVQFDDYLRDALGLDGTRAREYVLAVFGGAVSPELSIGSHAARISEWMTGASQEVDDALVGGIEKLPEIELAAQAFALGVPDGVTALTTSDPARLVILACVVRRTVELRRILDDQLAVNIANRVGELFKR